jgi:hypothetical protein
VREGFDPPLRAQAAAVVLHGCGKEMRLMRVSERKEAASAYEREIKPRLEWFKCVIKTRQTAWGNAALQSGGNAGDSDWARIGWGL